MKENVSEIYKDSHELRLSEVSKMGAIYVISTLLWQMTLQYLVAIIIMTRNMTEIDKDSKYIVEQIDA